MAPKPFSFSVWEVSLDSEGACWLGSPRSDLRSVPCRCLPAQTAGIAVSLGRAWHSGVRWRHTSVLIVDVEKRRAGMRDSCVNISIKRAARAEPSPSCSVTSFTRCGERAAW